MSHKFGALRRQVIDHLAEVCAGAQVMVDEPVGSRLVATVFDNEHSFRSLLLRRVDPGPSSTAEGSFGRPADRSGTEDEGHQDPNVGIVGPARLVTDTGDVTGWAIRLDLPPGSTRRHRRHAISHALDLAGWTARWPTSEALARRRQEGFERIERTFRRLGLDQDELLLLDDGYLVGIEAGPDCGSVTANPQHLGDHGLAYCVLHVIEDCRGVAWLRASALAGVTTQHEAAWVNSRAFPVMVRQFWKEVPPKAWYGRPDHRPVFAVADIDLTDASEQALSWLVWAVADFAARCRTERWPADVLPSVPLHSLGESVYDGLGPVWWFDPSPIVLFDPATAPPGWPPSAADRADDPRDGGVDDEVEEELRDLARRRAQRGPWETDAESEDQAPFDQAPFDEEPFDEEPFEDPDSYSLDDSPFDGSRRRSSPAARPASTRSDLCRFHPSEGERPATTCRSCTAALAAGGSALAAELARHGVISAWERREIEHGLDASDHVRRHQAETRLQIKVAQCAPVLDLTQLDGPVLKKRLAERMGDDNPSYRTACLIVEMLVEEGLNDPVLLVGPPGLGKTFLASEVAAVLGLQHHSVPLGSAAGRHAISGSDVGFRNADRGAVIGGVAVLGTPQYVLGLDEIEKLAGHASDDYPLGALLAMLDDHRACFSDQFVGTEPGWQVDLTSTIVVATANDLAAIPEPLVSRCRVIEVHPWTAEEKLAFARRWATRTRDELGLDEPIGDDVLRFVVDACPHAGIRELDSALRRCQSMLAAGDGPEAIEPFKLFPPSPPTPVASRSLPAPSTAGVTRAVALGPKGWIELRCTATPNGTTRWAGNLDALAPDADTFVLHWVPMLHQSLGAVVPCCTLHLDPHPVGQHKPAGLPVAMLAAVASVVTGLAADHRVVAPLRADPTGRLVDLDLTPADLAGLVKLGVETIVLSSPIEGRGIEWQRADLPAVRVATTLVELLDVLVPGLSAWQRRSDHLVGGYL